MEPKVTDRFKIGLVTNQSSIAIVPCLCAVKAKHKYFHGWKIVGHVLREASRYIYFLIKKEGRGISGNVNFLNYRLSLILSGGLEVHLLLTFSNPKEWVRNKMKDFINDFYKNDFTGIIHNNDTSDESDIEIDLEFTEKEEDKKKLKL